ncbi:hypothetical protein L6164_029470 [Bauhinia variegata]|uniref:Uncharacterized protein n=1 Tax=Bauhinia variegata TaxID=167791 RepID=A0ACB9L8X0_BAUVA|nr:hypothetical protein L6164_029470 [Bauhinia variegata]
MGDSHSLSPLLILLLLYSLATLVPAQGSRGPTWNTLSGNKPLVIARGGFSGIFPDSSSDAYSLTLLNSVPDVTVWCDVQLTKDAAGICLPDINLNNATNIASVFPNQTKTYLVNGVPTSGYFSIDYTLKNLSTVILTQGVFSRTDKFDGTLFQVLTIEDLATQIKPPHLWLNIQHDQFYTQNNLSARNFVLSVSRRAIISYISSPEVGFLRSISTRFNPNITKLVFRFLGQDDVESTTNQTYGSLLNNLTDIKSFASGILVPKDYIWPVDAALYLQPHTTLVSDAHKVGLEVFAADFVNDVPFSFNYSYDPIAEYLSFIDNGNFSVDGVLSDFPITPSEAIDCFAHLGTNARIKLNTLVLSKYGASGDYPACTNIAYNQAISDGVDVLDCPVQISKDGTPFCLNSIDLIESTNVVQTNFSKLATTIPGIKSGSGIFTFSLTWNAIKTLKPSILNPYLKAYTLFRNPKYKNSGTFLTLSDFLSLTKNQTSLQGVLISIENAAYLAEKEGLDVIGAVLGALAKSGYSQPGKQKVLIQSTDSSLLLKIKEKANYELVYKVEDDFRDAVDSAVADIKNFAHSVVLDKSSVFTQNVLFLTGSTNIVSKLKSANLSVYVETFSNEFVSQAWDFFSDSTVEINSYVLGSDIDGVITDFPKTANRYRRNLCLSGVTKPPYMIPVQPGALLQLVAQDYLPPAEAPLPVLTDRDISEPPLPPVSLITPTPSPAGTRPGASPRRNSQPKVTVSVLLSSLAVFVASFFFCIEFEL